MPETQEMLDFCSKHNVVPECKTIHAKEATAQFKALADGTAGAARAVIDMSTLKDL
jgi:D-arabinose 1-dehydrogenase-like Zn-dependent alcohol dehydrogenase